MAPVTESTPCIEIRILAGGLSSRMGRDKARLRIGGQTMLARVRTVASSTGLPVRVIRRDAVERCGPLGGIITGFRRTRADALLFLACDMPLITADVLKRVIQSSANGRHPAFAACGDRSGFPFLIPRSVLSVVESQRALGEYSLRRLAERLNAARVRVRAGALFNINTPDELSRAEQLAGTVPGQRITKKTKSRRARGS